jgi:toxin HigB-1
VKIRNVVHRGLRRFIEREDASGLPAVVVPKVRNIVSFLESMGQERAWSLFVTRNWRITFRINQDEIEISDLDFEDYH